MRSEQVWLIQDIYKKLGEKDFFRKIIEELNELAVSVSHYQDGKIQQHEVFSEMADVSIQLDKLILLFSNFDDHSGWPNTPRLYLSKKIDDIKYEKLVKLRRYLDDKAKAHK